MTPDASGADAGTETALAPQAAGAGASPPPEGPAPEPLLPMDHVDTVETYTAPDSGARYHAKPVEILRAATDHDAGFIPGRSDAQLLVKHPDGTLQVVFADRVTNPDAPNPAR